MAAIERTAYPRFKRNPTRRELEEIYTPTAAELAWTTGFVRDDAYRLHLLLWLKSFQRLGYFPRLQEIPAAVVDYLRTYLQLEADVQPVYDQERTLYRHQQAVRDYLQIKPFDAAARQ